MLVIKNINAINFIVEVITISLHSDFVIAIGQLRAPTFRGLTACTRLIPYIQSLTDVIFLFLVIWDEGGGGLIIFATPNISIVSYATDCRSRWTADDFLRAPHQRLRQKFAFYHTAYYRDTRIERLILLLLL